MDAIIFLVDTVDRARFGDAKKELDGLLAIDELQHVPFLILGNKIDMPGAASEDDLRHALGLLQTTGKHKNTPAEIRPVEVFMCSLVQQLGYGEGFRWLSNYLK